MKPHQKELVKNFREFTNCKTDTAEKFLSQNGWDFNNAINSFFEKGYVQPADNAQELFARYKTLSKDSQQEIIDSEGFVRFLDEINIDFSDSFCGYILYLMQTEDPSEITFPDFSRFISHTNSQSIQSIKNSVSQLRKQYQKPQIFKEVYNNLFRMYSDNPKFINLQNAIALWGLYLKGRFTLYEDWMKYIESYNKPISKDVWTMVLEFQYATKGNLQNYQETDGWPIAIDNFVEYLRTK